MHFVSSRILVDVVTVAAGLSSLICMSRYLDIQIQKYVLIQAYARARAYVYMNIIIRVCVYMCVFIHLNTKPFTHHGRTS